MSLTKRELTEIIAKKANLTNKASKDVIRVFLNTIRDSLKRNEKVVLTGFGTFKTVPRKIRKGRNPKTGAPLTIAAHRAPVFTAGKALKKLVK